jgi:hypothetical protein
MSIGGGKSGSSGTQVYTAQPTPEQRQMIQAQTDFFTGTVAPTTKQVVGGAMDLYNQSAPGVNFAAQNLAGTARQAQDVLGRTGTSALQTGVNTLEQIGSPEYVSQQLQAALQPAQAQYQQNLANQSAMFGGTGQLGSARDAFARTQLAGTAQQQQQMAAAQVMRDVAQQKLSAGSSLAGLGQGGLGQAIGAASQGVTASMVPQQLYNMLVGQVYGIPQGTYTPNFSGTQSGTTSGSQQRSNIGFDGMGFGVRG